MTKRGWCSATLCVVACLLWLGYGCAAPTGGGGSGGQDNGNANDGNDNAGGGGSSELIFPADFAESFRMVRDCRNSFEGHPENVRVFVNEDSADAYLNNENPLPIGTVVVKEIFAGVGCEGDGSEFSGWSAMRKMEAGFDAEDGDWAWQETDAEGAILFNDKTLCIGCHRDPDCVVRDYMCTEP